MTERPTATSATQPDSKQPGHSNRGAKLTHFRDPELYALVEGLTPVYALEKIERLIETMVHWGKWDTLTPTPEKPDPILYALWLELVVEVFGEDRRERFSYQRAFLEKLFRVIRRDSEGGFKEEAVILFCRSILIILIDLPLEDFIPRWKQFADQLNEFDKYRSRKLLTVTVLGSDNLLGWIHWKHIIHMMEVSGATELTNFLWGKLTQGRDPKFLAKIVSPLIELECSPTWQRSLHQVENPAARTSREKVRSLLASDCEEAVKSMCRFHHHCVNLQGILVKIVENTSLSIKTIAVDTSTFRISHIHLEYVERDVWPNLKQRKEDIDGWGLACRDAIAAWANECGLQGVNGAIKLDITGEIQVNGRGNIPYRKSYTI